MENTSLSTKLADTGELTMVPQPPRRHLDLPPQSDHNVTALHFVQNGSALLACFNSVAQTAAIILWDPSLGQIKRTVQLSISVRAVSVSDTTTIAILGCHSSTWTGLRGFCVRTGQTLWVQEGLQPTVCSLSPQGWSFVCLDEKKGSIQIRRVQTGQWVRTVCNCDKGAGNITLSSDGASLLYSQYLRVDVLRATNAKRLRQLLHSLPVQAIVPSPYSSQVCTISGNNQVRVWDLKTGAQLFRITRTDLTTPGTVLFANQSRWLVTAFGEETTQLCGLRMWCIATQTCIATLDACNTQGPLALSPDGRSLAAVCGHKAGTQVWDLSPLLRRQYEARCALAGLQWLYTRQRLHLRREPTGLALLLAAIWSHGCDVVFRLVVSYVDLVE